MKKIAIIAPPFTTIPPKGQGGTERIAYEMAEGLTKKGYDITLFGAGKYKGKAKFFPVFEKTISQRNFDPTFTEASRPLRIEGAYMAKLMPELSKYDVVFNHCRAGYLLLPLAKHFKIKVITILHLPIFKEVADVLSNYKNIVTISNNQRKGFKLNYLKTVYNGINVKEFQFSNKPKDYFLFMGAIGPHKNPKDAIKAAKKAGVKLVIASGKIRQEYFEKEIRSEIDGKQIKFIGEVSGKERIKLFKEAKAFLFPIKWQEPFGLVMAEAMACGTPVIAYPNGATREVVEDKKTGFIVKSPAEMAKAIKNIDQINRKDCRERVEKLFTVEKMVNDYEKLIS